jgi:hypothetical protein
VHTILEVSALSTRGASKLAFTGFQIPGLNCKCWPMDDLHREQLSYIDSHKPSSPGSPHRHFSIRLTRADYVPRSPSPPLRSLSPNHGHVPLSPPLASPLRERSLSPTHGQLSRLQLDQYHGQPFSCHSRTIKREERLIVSSQGGRREVLERRTMYSDPVLQALLTSPTTLPHEKERHFEGKDQQRRRAGSPSLLQRTQPTQHRAHVSPTALRLAPPQSQQTLHRRAPSPTLLRHSLSPSKSSKSQTPRVLPISVQAQSQLPTMTRSSPPRPSTDYTVFPEFPQRAISYSVSKRDGFTEGAHKTNNDNSGPEFNDQNQNQNQVFGGLGWLQAARDALLSQYNASIDALGCSPAADAKPSDKGLLISRKFDNGPRRDSFSHSHFNRGGSCNAAYAPGTASIGLVVGRVDGAVVVNTLVYFITLAFEILVHASFSLIQQCAVTFRMHVNKNEVILIVVLIKPP